jgi:signal transduction histidine kinase
VLHRWLSLPAHRWPALPCLCIQKLDEQRAESEGANRAKTAFVAMLSHELRTPLHGTPPHPLLFGLQ